MRSLSRPCGLATVLVMANGVPGFAADVPVPAQPAGEHSTVSTSDGSVRDDVLAEHICDAILAHQAGGGTGPTDVKFMLNSCYGGGVLDDIQRVFGPSGPCAGIPWVGGSASEAHEPAYGWADSVVNAPANAGKNLGSTWTDALAGTDVSPSTSADGSILQGSGTDTVLGDLVQAGLLDDSGPNGDNSETPKVGSGNGGDTVQWAGGKHEAVVFGGSQTDARHSNNVNKVTNALNQVWGSDPKHIQTLDGGTTAQLLGAITTAVNNLDSLTQLVIYIDDHGDTHFDINEFIGSLFVANPITGSGVAFNLNPGLFEGLAGNALQGDPVNPTIDLLPQAPFDSGDWNFWLNEQLLPLPPGPIGGSIQVPIDWEVLRFGPHQNFLFVTPVVPGAQAPIILEQLELSSGPINEIDKVQGFSLGPVQGQGCVLVSPDELIGNPGGAAPIPGGVASTATHAIYHDNNGDGTVQVICEATREFGAQPSDVMITGVDVAGTWSSTDGLDVSATFTVLVDQGGPPLVVENQFTASHAGAFAGANQSAPFSTGATENTLRVIGEISFESGPGFELQMDFPGSIRAFVLPEPSALLSLGAGALLVASLARARRR